MQFFEVAPPWSWDRPPPATTSQVVHSMFSLEISTSECYYSAYPIQMPLECDWFADLLGITLESFIYSRRPQPCCLDCPWSNWFLIDKAWPKRCSIPCGLVGYLGSRVIFSLGGQHMSLDFAWGVLLYMYHSKSSLRRPGSTKKGLSYVGTMLPLPTDLFRL